MPQIEFEINSVQTPSQGEKYWGKVIFPRFDGDNPIRFTRYSIAGKVIFGEIGKFKVFDKEGKPSSYQPEDIISGKIVCEDWKQVMSISSLHITTNHTQEEAEAKKKLEILIPALKYHRMKCLRTIEVKWLNKDFYLRMRKFPEIIASSRKEYSREPNVKAITEGDLTPKLISSNPLIPECQLVCEGKIIGYLNETGTRLSDLTNIVFEYGWA